jgi:hypothetical protein
MLIGFAQDVCDGNAERGQSATTKPRPRAVAKLPTSDKIVSRAQEREKAKMAV